MRIMRGRTALVFLFAMLSGAGLLHVSQMVQNAEDELSRAQRSIIQERENIRVLDAEWAYLNSPQRLEVLAQEYLELDAPNAAKSYVRSYVLPTMHEINEIDLMQKTLVRDASLQDEISVVYVPAPKRKPEILKQDFGDLMDRLEARGGSQ